MQNRIGKPRHPIKRPRHSIAEGRTADIVLAALMNFTDLPAIETALRFHTIGSSEGCDRLNAYFFRPWTEFRAGPVWVEYSGTQRRKSRRTSSSGTRRRCPSHASRSSSQPASTSRARAMRSFG
jgi:hypothetical protein